MKFKIFIICLMMVCFYGCTDEYETKFTVDEKTVVWNHDEFDITKDNTLYYNIIKSKIECIGGYLYFQNRCGAGSYNYFSTQIMVNSEDGKSSHGVMCKVIHNKD